MGGGGSKDTDDKISQLSGQVAQLNTEGQQAIAQLAAVAQNVQGLRDMMNGINGTQSKIKDDMGRMATDITQIKKDIADIHQALAVVQQDHLEEIAALNNLSAQLSWSTMVLEIAEPAQRIESMYSFLSKLSLGSKTAARWFIRDVLSPSTGVLEALNAIHAVLIGQVIVDPKQGSMLLQFKTTLANSGLSAANQHKALLSYFNSLAFLQIKGIILLTNAFRAIGDNALSATYVKEIRTNIYQQYVLLWGSTYSLVITGVNHGSHHSSLMAGDSISLNNQIIDTLQYDQNLNPIRNPFSGFHVTVLPICDPYLVLRSAYFDTTTDAGQTAMAAYLNNERAYCDSSILIVASTGPAGTTCNAALTTEMTNLIGTGFHGLDNDTIWVFACIGGDIRIITAPQTNVIATLNVKLELDPNNPGKMTFPTQTVKTVPHGLLGDGPTIWNDVLIRTGTDDVGQVPYSGASWVSPDIINNGADPAPDPSIYETQASYNAVFNVNGNYQNNITNNIYIRLKNMNTTSSVDVTVRLYESPGNLLNNPASFTAIPSIRDDEDPSSTQYDIKFTMAPGAIRVTPRPFLWNPNGTLDHTCLITMVATAAHPFPNLQQSTALDIAASYHPNIAQRNISLVQGTAPSIEHVVSCYIDLSASYQFYMDYNSLPVDSTISFESTATNPAITKIATTSDTQGSVGTLNIPVQAGWNSSFICRAACPGNVPSGGSLTMQLYKQDDPPPMTRAEYTAFVTSGKRIVPSKRTHVGAYCIYAN